MSAAAVLSRSSIGAPAPVPRGSITRLPSADTSRWTLVAAAVAFGTAAGSWGGSPRLRDRLLAAVRQTTAPVFFIHAANDYSVAPGKALDAAMARAGRSHRLKIYPAVGFTPRDGHDFIHQRVSSWETDVFTFLGEHTRR